MSKPKRPGSKEDVCKWFTAGGGMWSADCCGEMQRYPDSGYCPNCGCEIIVDDYGPDPPWPKEEIISPEQPSLLPCPACGGEAHQYKIPRYVKCLSCLMTGPDDDPTGEKWNALPRKSEHMTTHESCYICEDRGQRKERQRWIAAVRNHIVPEDSHTTNIIGHANRSLKGVFRDMGVENEGV